jgi:hypothetical protein
MTRHVVIDNARHIHVQCDTIAEQVRESLAYLSKYEAQPSGKLKPIPDTDDAWYNPNQAPQHRQHRTRPESMRVK